MATSRASTPAFETSFSTARSYTAYARYVRHQNFWATWQADLTEALAHPLLTLSRSVLVLQATVLNGQFLDLLPSFDDGRVSTEVDVGRRYVP